MEGHCHLHHHEPINPIALSDMHYVGKDLLHSINIGGRQRPWPISPIKPQITSSLILSPDAFNTVEIYKILSYISNDSESKITICRIQCEQRIIVFLFLLYSTGDAVWRWATNRIKCNETIHRKRILCIEQGSAYIPWDAESNLFGHGQDNEMICDRNRDRTCTEKRATKKQQVQRLCGKQIIFQNDVICRIGIT